MIMPLFFFVLFIMTLVLTVIFPSLMFMIRHDNPLPFDYHRLGGWLRGADLNPDIGSADVNTYCRCGKTCCCKSLLSGKF